MATTLDNPTAPSPEKFHPDIESAFTTLRYYLFVTDEEMAAEDGRPIAVTVGNANALAVQLLDLACSVADSWPTVCMPTLLTRALDRIGDALEDNLDELDETTKEVLRRRVDRVVLSIGCALGDNNDDV